MNEYDHYQTYCRSLGDCIHFSYCRAAGGEQPCGRILECWAGRLPVVEFLKKHYTPEVLERVFAPQPGRLQRIMDIAEKVAGSGSRVAAPPSIE
ncbi:MAG: hypothetical protein JXB06_02165 [Spirochaetales bacterium]|nr:hypothetical protein [Spirochaetales bacterium]